MRFQLKKYIGTKEFYLQVLALAIPIMTQQFVTSFVNLIDNVMIGSVGATALTSVTVANKLYLVFNSTLFGLGGGAGIYIAQFYGAQNDKRCRQTFNINMDFAVFIAAFYFLLASFAPAFILGLFTKTPEILNLGLSYVNIIKYSYLPNALSFTVMMSLRSVGETKVPLYVGMMTVLTNTFLNYCLIYGHFGLPALGVQGAALATLIARIVECVIYFCLLLSKKLYFYLDLPGIIKLDFSLISKIMVRALPLTANEILFSLGMATIFKAYMRCDEYLVAAITVVDTVVNIFFIIFGGLSSAVSIMVGKMLGANRLDEAKENAYKLLAFGVMVALVLSTILMMVAPLIPSIYHLEEDINRTIVTLLRIKACMIPIYVFNVCAFFTLRAGGDAKSTLIMDSGFLWGVSVTVSTFLSIYAHLPLTRLYLMVEGMDIIKMGVAMYYMKKGTWIRNLAD